MTTITQQDLNDRINKAYGDGKEDVAAALLELKELMQRRQAIHETPAPRRTNDSLIMEALAFLLASNGIHHDPIQNGLRKQLELRSHE